MKNHILKFCVLSIICITVNFKCYSQTIEKEDKTLSPYFFVKSEDPSIDRLPLLHTEANVNIAGVIADVKVTQIYKNEGEKALEAIYIFPASTRAAIYDMKMTIGERVIIAKIMERQKAREEYEQAKNEGKSASLLEQHRPNVFQMNVANIMPGDSIIVEMSYTETLIPTDGVYEFVYPTVVGPRYSDQPVAVASTDEKWVENPYTHSGENPLYTYDMKVTLNTGIPVMDVKSTSHEVNVNFDGDNSANIVLKDSDKYAGNKDFILNYRLKGDKIESGLLLYKGKDENFFLMMMQPPKRIAPEDIPAREYIFIVDVSGSMNGFPLDISKKLLKDLIGNLRPNDKFNVLLFAGGSQLMSEKSLPATKENIKKAINIIDNQRGGGGTQLLPALRKALALTSDKNLSRSIIIATDGYVTVEKEAFDLIRKSLGNANLFSFGIGSSVNRYIIEGLAHVGMGEPFIITNESEAVATAEKFRNYIQSPVLTNIQLSYKDFNVYDVEPLGIPDVFAERPIMVYGKWKGNPTGEIRIYGKNGTGNYSKSIKVEKSLVKEKNKALRYLWARKKIQMLDDYKGLNYYGDDNIKDEMVKLGLQYNLLTAYTSFVAIDSNVRNKDKSFQTVKQPLPLPEGVSDYAVGASTTGSLGAMYAPQKLQRQGKVKYSSNKRSYGGGNDFKALAEIESVVSEVEIEFDDNEIIEYSKASIKPEFPGGELAMEKFIKDNLKYPKNAKDKSIQGIVIISFIIDENGKIKDIEIINGLIKELDEEAIRIIKKMPDWKPGEKNGKVVKVKMSLPIKFSLN